MVITQRALLFSASVCCPVDEDLGIARWLVRRRVLAILLSGLDWFCLQDALLC
jgi:hypothetical protein